MFWSLRSKRISLGQDSLKPRYFGRAGRNVSRLVEPARNIEVRGRNDRKISRLVKLSPNLEALVALVKTYLAWSKHRCFGPAGRNGSCLIEFGRNLDDLVASVETDLAWSNLFEP